MTKERFDKLAGASERIAKVLDDNFVESLGTVLICKGVSLFEMVVSNCLSSKFQELFCRHAKHLYEIAHYIYRSLQHCLFHHKIGRASYALL